MTRFNCISSTGSDTIVWTAGSGGAEHLLIVQAGIELQQLFPYFKKLQGNDPDLVISFSNSNKGIDWFYQRATVLMSGSGLPRSPEAVPNLEVVQVPSAGVDWLESEPLYDSDKFTFCSASGIHGPTISEWVIMTYLSHARRLPYLINAQHDHRAISHAEYGSVHDSINQRVGILGYGSIGRQVAKVAKAMGMQILAYTAGPRKTKESKRDEGYYLPGTGDPDGDLPDQWFSGTSKEALHDFLGQDLDLLVICVPLTKQTNHLIGKEEFKVLSRRNTFVSNIARGQIIVQEDMIEALQQYEQDSKFQATSRNKRMLRGIRGAAVDVTDPEPLSKDDPLWDAPNIMITPHISGSSDKSLDRLMGLLIAQMKRRRDGKEMYNVVKRAKGYGAEMAA